MLPSDLQFFMSVGEGSDGGAISALVISQAQISQLFPPVTSDMALYGWTDYRKIFMVNTNATDTLGSAGIWLLMAPGNGQQINVGIGNANDTDGTLITYFEPNSVSMPIPLGDAVPNQATGIWLQRVVPALTPCFKQPCFFQLGLQGQANLG